MERQIKVKSHEDSQRLCIQPLRLFLLFSPFLIGGFFEWLSCLFSLFLIGYLLYIYKKKGQIVVRANLTIFMLAVVVLCHGISVCWAVDQGMALLGFCKFLPLLLFALTVMQFTDEERTSFLNIIPFAGAVMTVASVVLGLTPLLHDVFWVNARLAGLFQYTNAFAAFLLAGVIILIGEKGLRGVRQLSCLLALLTGIILSGSRTVFFLLAAVLFVFVLMLKGKIRWVICLLMAVMVAATVLYVELTGNVDAVGRYLTTSLNDSTFLGRILYFKDALPVIFRHPLGLGYKGYFYMQGSFQTGVYSLLNVHNELLQILLDIGWVPAVLLIAAGIQSFVKKGNSLTKRMLIAAIAAHSLFDFDLQFICLGFVLILAMDFESGRDFTCRKWIRTGAVGSILAGICIWLGVASGLYHFGRAQAAVKLYPGYTDAWLEVLSQLENADEMENIADEILSWNSSISLAYSAKARTAYARGDFGMMISCKRRAIALSKYNLEEYLDYFEMLYVGVQLYMSNGDRDSAEICLQQLMEIPIMLEEVLENTDEMAWKIKDKPNLTLPEEYQEILDSLLEVYKFESRLSNLSG